MAKTISAHKKVLAQKMLEFEKKGLQQYGKFLEKQLKLSESKKSYAKFKKHIEQHITVKDMKVQGIEMKLNKFA